MNRFLHIQFEAAAVATPQRRSSRLSTAIANAHRTTALSTTDLRLLRHLFHLLGLDLHAYQSSTLARRMPALWRSLRCTQLEEALERVRDEMHRRRAANTILIGTTQFFRDQDVFKSLQDIVLPDLCSRNRALKLLSIGCSDGSELYSVLMQLHERGFENATLTGIDCRQAAIDAAARGYYDDEQMMSVPRAWRDRYFLATSNGWQVREAFRALLTWYCADALTCDLPQNVDLLLCRNVAIYLKRRAQSTFWTRITESLRSGGYLVVGKAERPVGIAFEQIASCIYRRR